MPLEKLAGKTGLSKVTLSERSPLSKREEIAKRISAKPGEIGADYDLSKEAFDIYVPASAGDDGKYGVMVQLDFNGNHAAPAKPWGAMLDKYHLIWIGAENAPMERSQIDRIGLMLDGEFNVAKAFPVDELRVYACISCPETTAAGAAYYFSDVFQGAIVSPGGVWFAPIPNSKRGYTPWTNKPIPMPPTKYLSLAKMRSRIFLAQRSEGADQLEEEGNDLLKNGFLRSGFKYVKTEFVPGSKMGEFSDYAADWFENGVLFLDAPLPQLRRMQAASAKVNSPAETGAPSSPDAATAQAESALSMAKNYIALQKYDAARARLQKIIATYPGTPAAKKAVDLLQQIEGK